MESAAFSDAECEGLVLVCIRSLLASELVQRSPRGKVAANLLTSIEKHRAQESLKKLCLWLVSSTQACLEHGYSHHLPSHVVGEIWRQFHVLRCEKRIISIWESYLAMLSLPQVIHQESELTLQLLLEETLRRKIKIRADLHTVCNTPVHIPILISSRKENAIQYMAGYVVAKLLQRFKKPVKQPLLINNVCNSTQRVSATDVGHVDTPAEYALLWTELIDRGGLYHVNVKVIAW